MSRNRPDEYWEDPRRRREGERARAAEPRRGVEPQRQRPDYDEPYEQPRQYQRPPQRPPARRRSAWPVLLIGCAGGVALAVLIAAGIVFWAARSISGGSILPLGPSNTVFTAKNQQNVLMSQPVTVVQVHDQVGDVTISTDPNATSPQVTATKKAKASSQDGANAEFKRIAVKIQPNGSVLVVSATVPDTSNGDAVDLALSLPASVNAPGTPIKLGVDLSVGNVTMTGVNGVITVKDDAGNITVRQAQLADGSSLRTATGDVTFSGTLDTSGSANPAPKYQLHSEVGNIDVTLPASTNVVLDANTNTGKIISDFSINVTENNGSATFHGPLIPNTTPPALLSLDVGSGNITLHKA